MVSFLSATFLSLCSYLPMDLWLREVNPKLMIPVFNALPWIAESRAQAALNLELCCIVLSVMQCRICVQRSSPCLGFSTRERGV